MQSSLRVYNQRLFTMTGPPFLSYSCSSFCLAGLPGFPPYVLQGLECRRSVRHLRRLCSIPHRRMEMSMICAAHPETRPDQPLKVNQHDLYSCPYCYCCLCSELAALDPDIEPVITCVCMDKSYPIRLPTLLSDRPGLVEWPQVGNTNFEEAEMIAFGRKYSVRSPEFIQEFRRKQLVTVERIKRVFVSEWYGDRQCDGAMDRRLIHDGDSWW